MRMMRRREVRARENNVGDDKTMETDDGLVDEIFGPVCKDHQGDEELTEPIGFDEGDGAMEAGEIEGDETERSSLPVSYAMPPARSGMLPVSGMMRIAMNLFRNLHACNVSVNSPPIQRKGLLPHTCWYGENDEQNKQAV